MKNISRIFNRSDIAAQHGGMMVELLLSVALAAVVMPFIFQYQQRTVRRAENIAIARDMENIEGALERYIVDNRDKLLETVGQSITRVDLEDLAIYGINPNILENAQGRYQLRILKSQGASASATLQGVVVFSSPDITPLRTREITSLGAGRIGFVDGKHTYGNFGTWRTNTASLGLAPTDGIIGTTTINRDNALYLWRMPSDNAADATMLSPLSIGGHDVINATYLDGASAQFSEFMNVGVTAANTTIFQNRTTLDQEFGAVNATVSGMLSADAKELEVNNTFKLADTGKFSTFATGDMWVSNLSLSGLSVYDDGNASVLNINKTLDMTGGRISAMYTTVSFAGSITPRLDVSTRIEDSINSDYYWDARRGVANFLDVTFAILNDLAETAVYKYGDASTVSTQVFGAVSANKNATAADYMNAITEIQKKVRAKYRQLNLE